MTTRKASRVAHRELAKAVYRLDALDAVCRARPDEADPNDLLEALGEVYRASQLLVRRDARLDGSSGRVARSSSAPLPELDSG